MAKPYAYTRDVVEGALKRYHLQDDETPPDLAELEYIKPKFGKHALPPAEPVSTPEDDHPFAGYKSAKDATPFDFFISHGKLQIQNPYGIAHAAEEDYEDEPEASRYTIPVQSAATGVKFWDFASVYDRGLPSKPGTAVKSVAPLGFVPKCRLPVEVVAEDIKFQNEYAEVGVHDENLIVYGCQRLSNVKAWQDFDFPPQLLSNIGDCMYVKPRQVQRVAIPLILDTYDVIAVTEPGTGKTLTYLVGIITTYMRDIENWFSPRPRTPYALIIAPTRELVQQIYEQTKKLTNKMHISVAKAYGEYSFKANALEVYNCSILVATPGRLHHFFKEGIIDLSCIRFIVFDEGDTLIGSNHMDDIEPILNSDLLPDKFCYQTLFFGATFQHSLIHLATMYMRERQSIAVLSEKCATSKLCKQEFELVLAETRFGALQKLLYSKLAEVNNDYRNLPQILIFVNSQAMVDELFSSLENLGFPVAKIRGDFAQNCRFNFLNGFRNKLYPIIIASDVLARGIDLKEIDLVLNYEVPFKIGTYIYRVGRVGRIKEGKALSYVDPGYNRYFVRELADLLKLANHEISPEFKEIRKLAEEAIRIGENARDSGFETNLEEDDTTAWGAKITPPNIFNESF